MIFGHRETRKREEVERYSRHAVDRMKAEVREQHMDCLIACVYTLSPLRTYALVPNGPYDFFKRLQLDTSQSEGQSH